MQLVGRRNAQVVQAIMRGDQAVAASWGLTRRHGRYWVEAVVSALQSAMEV
jgi:hypothetical protein